MTTISAIFQTFAPEYIQRFGHAMPQNHLKTINAIRACRTSQCGILIYDCHKCGQSHSLFRSCGNRHCPTCQNHKTRQWVEEQMERQLPGHHFLITFTVPAQLRRFIRSHQRRAYAALFDASSQTLKKFAAHSKYIRGDLPGFFGVLHTWGRQLHYHPHIHYVVPGGAISKTDGQWHPSRIDFFAPVKAMSKVFKAKFRDKMKKIGLYEAIHTEVWDQTFNVNSQSIGTAQQTIRYLAPYVFKVAISDHRIVKVEHRKVLFRYKKPAGQRWRTMTLDVMEFIRRFLQHVLPTGFMKIRYYGFMGAGSSLSLNHVKLLILAASGFSLKTPPLKTNPVPVPVCPHCGAKLVLRRWIHPLTPITSDTS